MNTHYTDEKAIQVIISLLKAHGIRKVIASPGTTNLSFVASIQSDPYFEIYSSVDERSAAYLACGLSAETGEAVVLSCTGATASRNYVSGLTEAFYRKLPIIAITATQPISKIGHLIPQVIDRQNPPNDILKYSAHIPFINNDVDIWHCEIKVNTAFLECKRFGGGPVHLNVETLYSKNYNVSKLPKYRKIDRITAFDIFPDIPSKKIGIFIGAHKTMSQQQIQAIDNFCTAYNAVVFCDHTSNYRGKHALHFSLVATQLGVSKQLYRPDLLIHIGEVSGDYASLKISGKQVWRVNPDGEIRDTFSKLSHIFEMPVEYFFQHYADQAPETGDDSYLQYCKNLLSEIRSQPLELPFSNAWFASQLAHCIPDKATVHLGILNSLRCWNFFEFPQSVQTMSNVGGFGIDGGLSSLIGASFACPDKLYYMIIGDLAFFYDMNVIGNRHVGKNVRILLINNGKGTEFRNYNHPAAPFGDEADAYIAAGGHFGNKSSKLVQHYAQDLGYKYMSASNKHEFNEVYQEFIQPETNARPIIFEVFSNNEDESTALKLMSNIITCDTLESMKQVAAKVLPSGTKSFLRNIIKK